MLVSVDGAPFSSVFPPDAVRPGATVGAGLFPAICGDGGSVVEYSMHGDLGVAPPSSDYLPFAQVHTSLITTQAFFPSPLLLFLPLIV